jgi:glutamine amidotransferase
MIGIVDYGVANLGSMRNMLRRIGVEPELAGTPDVLRAADKLILPGIGAFDQGMAALHERGLVEPLRERVLGAGVPLLGVCLGVQLLGEGSEEGTRQGLCFVRARCRRFVADAAAGLRVPHMGWNHVSACRESPLLRGLDDAARFYFVHSYHVVCDDPADVLATAEYGVEFTAMVEHGNIRGAQFHPEKSHRFGMRLLQNYVEL